MSKKCVKCGHSLPEDASFCPHCTAIQVEKEEIRAPRRWKKKVFVIGVVLVFLAGVGFAFSLYHSRRSMRPTPGSFIRIRIIPTGFW